jgi:hypothetical protein
MKIQTTRQILNKVLDHYRDAVLQKFPFRFITPSSLAEMEVYLRNYQTAMIQRETNPVWAIPLKIIFDQKRNVIDMTPDEQADLEIIG